MDVHTTSSQQHGFGLSGLLPRTLLEMPPRYPIPKPGYGEVTDFGELLNFTNAATPYTHGLTGVNQTRNWLFANTLLICFMVLLAATFILRWTHMFKSYLRKITSAGRVEDQRYWMHNHARFWARIKKSFLYAPLGSVRHNRELQLSKAIGMGTLPSRFHTVLLGLYLASNVVYCLVLNWRKSDVSSVLAELRGRTGELAALNLVPTILFALRNNPLLNILGVSYESFNLLHRWAARIVVVETTIHTLCWAANSLRADGMHAIHLALSTSTSYRWGMVATCCFGFIFLTAPSPIRHAFYETFLNLHRLVVLVAITGVYVHISKANLPQLPYIQFVFAMWGFEYFVRCARLCYYNISRRKGFTKVTVEALPAEACRVTFDIVRPWHYTPGCHVHAYLPALALWSSHPFSVAWAETRPRSPPLELDVEKVSSLNASGMLPQGHRPSLVPAGLSFGTKSQASTANLELGQKPKQQLPTPAVPQDSKVTSVSLIMRARTGMTRKLYDRASASPNRSFTTFGAIEGPYGGHESFASYGTVVLFAGGVGITHCVGYVQHLLTQYQAGTCATQRLLLVWSVPNTEALEWVRVWMDQILRMEGRRDILRIQLFVTKPRHRGEVVSNTGSVQMFPGRCNPSTVLEKEMHERIGAMGVTVCGPGAFADSVRAAVRAVVTDGNVDFVEEAFTY